MLTRFALMLTAVAVGWFYLVLLLPPTAGDLAAAAERLNLGEATGRPTAPASLSGHPRRRKRAFKRPPPVFVAPAFLDQRRGLVRS